jgi:hypothetical protein
MNKTLEDFNFRKHNSYDIEKIKKHIDGFSDEWFINTQRQEAAPVHKHTNSYFVYSTDLLWKKENDFSIETTSKDPVLLELLEPIILDLEKIHNGTRAMVLLIKLKSEQHIQPHRDVGDYLVLSRRNHIPIITSDDVYFGVMNQTINMKPGDCWEINNSKPHYVDNRSTIERVHLVIDIMPYEEIGKK